MPRGKKLEQGEAVARQATKRVKFRQVAKRRMANVLTALDLLGQCSNRSSYEYGPSEVFLMVDTINKAVGAMNARYDIALTGKKDNKARGFNWEAE